MNCLYGHKDLHTKVVITLIPATLGQPTLLKDLKNQKKNYSQRGPGIGSHTGRQVRDGHLKGLGPNQTYK